MTPLAQACAALFGQAPDRVARLHGGDLSQVSLLRLPDGRQVVAKRGKRVAAEGRMLQAMAATGCPVPAVLGQLGELLFIEALDEGQPNPEGWYSAGEALATLHAATGAHYGWAEDYGFGPVTIANGETDDWPAFWAERRLLAHAPALPAAIARRLDRLAGRLGDVLPARPAAALLHGDLWAGNLLISRDGRAWLIDPACHYGHGEVDLAMLALFGAIPAAFREGYGPAAHGEDERRPVYQLWPAIVHLLLFGAGYRPMVERLLDEAGA